MMSEPQSDSHSITRASESHLVVNIRKQYKELRKEYERLNNEFENVKRNIKSTKINELTLENKVLGDQVEKLKTLYQHCHIQNQSLEKNIQNSNRMKEALSKQDYIILNFQENYAKMTEEIKSLNNEIEGLNNNKNKKEDMISKLKQKLKFQHQVNEKLILTRNSIRTTDEYLQMKNKYEAKLQQTRKDLAYFKDSNAKNEKMLRELKQYQNSSVQPSSIVNTVYASQPQTQSSNPTEQNSKILLLQSKYLEEKTEKEKLNKMIEELKQQLEKAQSEKKETKVILTSSFSTNNINKQIKINEYEYLSDFALNEFIYILLKN